MPAAVSIYNEPLFDYQAIGIIRSRKPNIKVTVLAQQLLDAIVRHAHLGRNQS